MKNKLKIKKRYRILIIVLLVLGIPLIYGLITGSYKALKGQSENAVSNKNIAQTGYYDGLDFRITPPSSWNKLNEQATKGTLVAFAAPNADQAKAGPFQTNITIVRSPLGKSSSTLKQDVEATMTELQKSTKNFKQVEQTEHSVNGEQSILVNVEYTAQYDDTLSAQQLYIRKNGYVYVVTATYLKSTADIYDKVTTASLLSFE